MNLALVDSFRTSLILDTLAELNRTLFRDDAVYTNPDASSGSFPNQTSSVDTLTAIWNSSALLTCAQTTPSHPGTSEKTPIRHPAASSPNPSDGAPPTAQASQTLKDYGTYLAEKDSVWFLCAVLHLLSQRSNLPSCASSPSLPSEYLSPTSSSSSFDPSSSVPAPSDPKSTLTRTVRSPTIMDVTREHMAEVVVGGILGLLSRCGKACRGSTRNGNLNYPLRHNSSSNTTDRLRGLDPATTSRKVAGANSSVSEVNARKAPAQETLSPVKSRGANSKDGTRSESGRRGCSGRGVDEAEYAMVLGAAEQVLMVYA
ncbi:hypothetical protein FA13DRAFT_1737486 [Coprinellus micaceus]|uniref:Uncharacterized protein n=1 Tax=Coprinellus micaceus TaxID=71717 RepID=A0A4Y7SYK8_COPMI|nr:hypothetical protein FA13DRAFT_1737486 [Coprinellus micaceus]